MTLPEYDVRLMLADFSITGRRVRKLIRITKLAAIHTQEKVRRVRMLEKQAAWKREGDFDRIKTVSEMYEETLRHLHAGFDPEPFYTGIYDPRRSPAPEEFTLDVRVEMECLRTELLQSKPPPLQYDLPPQARRSPVPPPPEIPLLVRRDMRKNIPLKQAQFLEGEDKVVPKSECPAQGGTFPFQAGVDGFLHVGCTRISEH